jgi:hypothetical protein
LCRLVPAEAAIYGKEGKLCDFEVQLTGVLKVQNLLTGLAQQMAPEDIKRCVPAI